MIERPPLLRVEIADPESGLHAYVVIDSLLHRFCAGGLRMSATVHMAEVESLARIMTYKMAMLGIPLGGAKSGIVLPAAAHQEQRTRLLAAFGKAVRPLIEAGYLIGEDMGTSAADIALVHEAAGINQAFFALQAAQDRGFKIEVPQNLDPQSLAEMETNLTGLGVTRAALAALEVLEKDIKGATVSIQGFGTVGAGSARHLAAQGAVIKAVADEQGTIYKEEGLDINELLAAVDARGVIARDKLGKRVKLLPGEAWLALPVDLLIPAAVPYAINYENVSAVKARAVIEAANIPVSMEAEAELNRRSILVAPDFVANAGTAGGLTVFLVGQAPLHPPTIYQLIGERIANATREVLGEAIETGRLPREIAEEKAEAFLDAQRDAAGFK